MRSARLLATGFVVFQRRPVGFGDRGLCPNQAGSRATRNTLMADELVHRRFVFAGRQRCCEDRFFSLAGHRGASCSNRSPITDPQAHLAQFRMLLRFSPGIAGCDVAPPCRRFLPPGLLRELAAAAQDEHPASFRFVRYSRHTALAQRDQPTACLRLEHDVLIYIAAKYVYNIL